MSGHGDTIREARHEAERYLGGESRRLLIECADALDALEAENALLHDDEAVMRGVAAVRRMLMLRVGGRHEHAEAFRAALAGGDEP